MKPEIRNTETSRAQYIYDQFKDRASRDDEFHDWAGYRDRLTEFVISCIPAGGSLLILGAGKCNDLDLRKLSEHCGSITLSDYRPESAEEAFRQYGLAPGENLNFAEADYVGITDGDYLEYTDLLLRAMEKLATQQDPDTTMEKLAGSELNALTECLERIYRDNADYKIALGGAADDAALYDNAVITGVHSQLNNSFRGLFQYVRKDLEDRGKIIAYPESLNNAIFQTTRKHTEKLVNRFNEAVFGGQRRRRLRI